MFQQFKTASYAHAEYLCKTDLSMLKEKIEEFLTWLPLDKVYLETGESTMSPGKRWKPSKSCLLPMG